MLYTLAVILLILWLLGLVSGYTIGAFIHVLLGTATFCVVFRLVYGSALPKELPKESCVPLANSDR